MPNDIETAPAIALPGVQSEKRVVLQHPSGLMQILGVLEKGEATPEFVDYDRGVTINGQPVAISLVAAKRTFCLYRPLMLPEHRETFKRR